MIFEFALARDSRDREHKADRTAAAVAGPKALVQSLIKIAAYSSYRRNVEERLFTQDRHHDSDLGIARFVADGLHPYASSPEFTEDIESAGVPHPYDSHPSLKDRMRNVAHHLEPAAFAAVVTAVPERTWVDDIPTAAAIEQRLWSSYESRFAQDHEHSLAYRFEPRTDAERDIVLRYFPPVSFDLAKGRAVGVSHGGLAFTDGAEQSIPWDDVKGIAFNDGYFRSSLVVTHPDRVGLTARKTKMNLRGLGKPALSAAISQYWERHQVMRSHQRQAASEQTAV